jgi:hypothetical protein
MQITRNSLETLTGPSDWFTGTVYVTEGVGLCKRRGGPIGVIRPGACVFSEPGEHVTDEEYGATPAGVEHPGAG